MNPPQQHLVNEKGRDLLPPPVPAAAPKATAADQRQARLPLFLGLSAVLLFVKALPYFFGSSIPVPHTQNCDHDRGILRSPNSTIRWKTCPDTPTDDTSRKQLCSSLQVPLNWLNPVKGETADIFLRMYPADEGKRMGSMLINPGGPGGSGSQMLFRVGPALSVIADDRYDIIGFDPRGVNLTTPHISAFNTEYERALFVRANPPSLVFDPTSPVNISDPVSFEADARDIRTQLARASIITDLIKERTTENERRAASTAFVVRDMVALVDALGEKDGLLTYWGFSYGTILGATFAAMRPGRVGRMILDGVSHAGDYTSGLHAWGMSSMTDSNKVLKEFFRLCAEVGPTRCALAPSSSLNLSEAEGTAHVQLAVFGLIKSLWEEPMQVLHSEGGPTLLTATDLHLQIFWALYKPAGWAPLAAAIAEGIKGNGTALANLAGADPAFENPKKGRRSGDDNPFHRDAGTTDAQFAILCSDEEPETGSVKDWIEFGDELRHRSFTGDMWRGIMLPCKTWTDRPFERYAGPWTKKDGLKTTKNKLLWIGNKWDPVTPLKSAKRMAEGFGRDSGSLLIQEGRGHCTIAEPSLCTVKHIRAYLVNGTVPEWGTTCVSEPGFTFPEVKQEGVDIQQQLEQENVHRELMRAVRDLSEMDFGLGAMGI